MIIDNDLMLFQVLLLLAAQTSFAQEPLVVHTAQSRVSSVPAGAQGVEVLHLSLTAPCSTDVPIYTVSLQKRGLGDRNDIESIYVRSAAFRLSRGRRINRKDGFVDIGLRRFTIPACETKDISIAIDLSDTASISAQHSFHLKSIDTGGIPMRIAASSVRPARRITTGGPAQGSVRVSYPSISKRRVRFGKRRRIAAIRLHNESRFNQRISSITLTNAGTARNGALQNIYLALRRSRPVTEKVDRLTGDTVVLTLSDSFILRRNRSVTFDVMSDITVGRSKTIRMIIEEPSDIATVNSSRRR